MKMAFAFILFMFLQTPPPTPGKATDNGGQKGDARQSQGAPDKTPTSQPVSVDNRASEKSQETGKEYASQNEDRPVKVLPVDVNKNWPDYVYIAANLIIAIATLVIAGIAWKQANAATLSVQAVINAERPWILVTAERVPGGQGYCVFMAYNKGRTPAQIVSGSATHEFAASPDDLKVPPTYKSPFNLPNNTLLVRDDSFPIYPDPGIKPETITPSRPNDILFFYGRIVYDDVLGKDRPGYTQHETRWCFAFFKDGLRFVRTGPDGSDEYNRYT
jgi:hypothetical protein